jgi:hypothetical protein
MAGGGYRTTPAGELWAEVYPGNKGDDWWYWMLVGPHLGRVNTSGSICHGRAGRKEGAMWFAEGAIGALLAAPPL